MELKLKCKLITPMFMAGSDRKTPELRPSEFKGMMRWWWRAIKAEGDIKKLKEEEARIFGGTGKGEGRSKVRIKIETSKTSSLGSNLKDDYSLKWYFDKNTRSLSGENAGIGYLLYSTVLPRNERYYIRDSYEFKLVITSMYEKEFKEACASLWLAIYLGGFGTRARRGGGNIEIVGIEDNMQNINFKDNMQNINFICEVRTTSDLKKFLEENLNKIKSIFNTNTNKTKPEYSSLSGAKILIFEPKNNWKEALNFLGEKYKNFRSNNKSKIFEMAAFGMPVIHNSPSKFRMVPYNNDRLSERWASPLIFKIIKSSNNLYFPLIVKLSVGGVNRIGKEEKIDKTWIKNSIDNFTEIQINDFLNILPKKDELVL
ncbi:MAG: type III-B CRISPR module RAMP protein Cmr1 [Thermoplasmata archaeon]